MSRFTFAALASALLSAPAAAQKVPARDLFEFPIGLLADAPALSTRMPASLWNPAARAVDSTQRASIGLAGLSTPQNQGVQLGMIGGEYQFRRNLSASFSFAQASVSDILRTETDPQSIGGEIPYGTSLLSAGLALTNKSTRFGIVSAGVDARYRWATVDQDAGSALSLDGALTILNDAAGLGIGARHITISTVGVLPGIVALGERPEQFRLAISIHAPSESLRRELMPINTKYPLADVIRAAKVFDRRVTFEYVMLGGVNDGPEHAIQLASLARECRAFVNLIPLHPGGARGFTPTPADQIRVFARELRDAGVEVAIRKSRGVDIAAACGQLRVERLGRRPPRRPDDDGNVQVA